MHKRLTHYIAFFIISLLILSACSISIDWGGQPQTTEPVTSGEPITINPVETASPGTDPGTTIGEPPELHLRVAYIDTSRNLWCWKDDGTTTQLTSSADVTDEIISPDGQWIAFVRTSSDWMRASIWVIGCDGSNAHILVSEDAFAMINRPEGAISTVPMQMAWIPGTQTLVYNTYPTFEGPGLMPNEDLWYAEADTGNNYVVLSSGAGGYFYISPDGSKLALVRPDSISLMNTDTTNLMQNVFMYTGMPTYSEYQYHAFPTWSLDSSYLRVAIPMSDPMAGTAQSITIYQIQADGSSNSVVGYFNALSFTGLKFSPDLNKVAYMLLYGEPANNMRTLRIANADGSSDTEIITAQLDFENWNPNSYDFVYSTWDPASTYITNPGLGTSYLAEQPNVEHIQWVDTGRFLYLYRTDTSWELRLGNLYDGSTLIAIMSYSMDSYMPSFSFAY